MVRGMRGWRRAAVGLLGLCCAGAAVAQSGGEMKVENQAAKGRYTVLPPRLFSEDVMVQASSKPLETWDASFTYAGTKYTYNMVGATPWSNVTATIPVYVIPVKLVITHSGKKYTYDPEHRLWNGNTVVTNTTESPIFQYSTKYVLGGVDVGTTQYIDAFQRANFWDSVSTHQNSHLHLGNPSVEAEQTLYVPSYDGTLGSPFGYTAGLVDINYFDAQLPNILGKLGIEPNALAIFLAYDVYLTQGGQCCIGGYHSSEGSYSNPQSYAFASYVDHPGTFAQDVSALSHEIGEWADDPLTKNPNGNNTPCGMLEVGDPLENDPGFGDHAYVLHGYTYHLQDLAMMPYFGAWKGTSLHGWYSFDNSKLGVCSAGS
jgi:hypothetical protein